MKKMVDIGDKPMYSNWGHPDDLSRFGNVEIT